MNSVTELDYLIVGQGLAGSSLALQLIKNEKKILVIDKPNENTSSKVAAGIFNPITGKNNVKTWLADSIFPYLNTFYREAETLTGQKFFFDMLLYHPFQSIAEQNEWMGKGSDPIFSSYVEKIYTHNTVWGINDNVGGLYIKQCGYLDVPSFIVAVQSMVKQKNAYLEETFNENELFVQEESVTYKGFKARKLIFCQGERNSSNKWFSWVPVIPLKGETLKIQTTVKQQQIINRGVYMVPAGFDAWRVGSTYNWNDKDRCVTAQGRQELEKKFQELVSLPFNVIEHAWGMRPTTHDRKPIIGEHPAYKSLVIFNGLGTKGVSLAPYFSDILFRWMVEGTDLIKEVNVNRYKSLYSKFIK